MLFPHGVSVSLGRGVDVFGLGQACELILVARQAAEENATADGHNGGAPAKPIRPGVVIVTLEDKVIELDGVDDESDELEDNYTGQNTGGYS